MSDEIKHYGVKGMKWGKRSKRDGMSRSDYSKSQVSSAIAESGGSKGKTIGKTAAKRAGQAVALRLGLNAVASISPPAIQTGLMVVDKMAISYVAASTVYDVARVGLHTDD